MYRILTGRARRDFTAFPEVIDDHILSRYFILETDEQTQRDDKAEVFKQHGDHNRLGFALQLCWLRCLGWQSVSLVGTPAPVIAFVAKQLNIGTECLSKYPKHQDVWERHSNRVRDHLGWCKCGAAERHLLLEHLKAEAQQHDNARGLLESAVSFLFRNQIVRPKLGTLEELIATARTTAAAAVEAVLPARFTEAQKAQMDVLLVTLGMNTRSDLEWLRYAPGKSNPVNLLDILDKLKRLNEIGAHRINLEGVHPNHCKALAQEAFRLAPAHLRRQNPDKRYSCVGSLLIELQGDVMDQSVEMHDRILMETLARSRGRSKSDWIKQENLVIEILRKMGRTSRIMADPQLNDSQKIQQLKALASQQEWEAMADLCDELTTRRDPDNPVGPLELSLSYIRQFSPRWLAEMPFRATDVGKPTLAGIEFARKIDLGEVEFKQPPLDFVPEQIRFKLQKTEGDAGDSAGSIDYHKWLLFLHTRIRLDLRAGALWVADSIQYKPLEEDIRVAAEVREAFLKNNPYLRDAKVWLKSQRKDYHRTLQRANGVWPRVKGVRIQDGRFRLSRLHPSEVPKGTQQLKQTLAGFMHKRTLPELMMEVLQWVDYLNAFAKPLQGSLRIPLVELQKRLEALVMSEGCNIGSTNIVKSVPGMTFMQLVHVAGRCLTNEAIEEALAAIVNYFDKMPIAKVWGKGLWSSSDGMLVPAPLQSLWGWMDPRAAKGKRMFNLFTYIYDRGMPYWGTVLSHKSSESSHELDGIFHHVTDLRPQRRTSDTAGYTDNLFGLATLFRIFYAPRIKGIHRMQLYYFDSKDKVTYSHIGTVLSAGIREDLIITQWAKIIDIAAAIEQRLVPPSRILRKLEAAGDSSDLYLALGEIGRIAKTMFIINYVSNPKLRRQIGAQTSKHESYNSLARELFYGNKGEMRLTALQDLRNRASCLRLMACIVMLHNAAYIQAAVKVLRERGMPVSDLQLRHIFPTMTAHVNFLGVLNFDPQPELMTKIDNLKLNDDLQPEEAEETW